MTDSYNQQEKQLINIIGELYYHFEHKENLDSLISYMKSWYNNLPDGSLKSTLTDSIYDSKSMAAFLLYKTSENEYPNMYMSNYLTWTINIEQQPIYAITHSHVYSSETYLIEILARNAGINVDVYKKYTIELNNNNSIAKDSLPSDLFNNTEKHNLMQQIMFSGFKNSRLTLRNRQLIPCINIQPHNLNTWSLHSS